MKRMSGAETEALRRVLLEAAETTYSTCSSLASRLPGLQKDECEYHVKRFADVLATLRANEEMYDLFFEATCLRHPNWERAELGAQKTETREKLPILRSPYSTRDIFSEPIQRAFELKEVRSVHDFAMLSLGEVKEIYREFRSWADDEAVIPFFVAELHGNLRRLRAQYLPSLPLAA